MMACFPLLLHLHDLPADVPVGVDHGGVDRPGDPTAGGLDDPGDPFVEGVFVDFGTISHRLPSLRDQSLQLISATVLLSR